MAAIAGTSTPTTAQSRAEINLVRLLHRCEAMASGDREQLRTQGSQLYRFEEYVRELWKMLEELSGQQVESSSLASVSSKKTTPSAVAAGKSARSLLLNNSDNVFAGYARRIDQLQALTQPDNADRIALAPAPSNYPTVRTDGGSSLLATPTTSEISSATAPALLGFVRKSPGAIQPPTDNNASKVDAVDVLLQHHRQVQDQLTDEMLVMAASLKQQARAALGIVQKDNLALDATEAIANRSLSKLKVENARLSEQIKRTKWGSCWIWLALIGIIVVFTWMVIFIKIVPKPKSSAPVDDGF
ncbi:hypothetical protein CAOG_02187 [Capsaspora owczarzaki ATCC 30864]|uniref:Vesicle transport protein USE1 n=1 Tax=Capsaspora owczarzaki (strain ATCC 30864) TaxID=595528 RepID=A0A0D2X1K5_CAPO3|nr:hypothetical protein CAOG_02187 [Capsaspora owczarzaki ATCC 30864]KJE90969.1 hypothetical protein CAOG_002187 [Capsaspora owczarzaki ATCC 30864]|eukprot:XP_004348937.2 hypothetical protein CAOG_02187 [Capsaspora owczarzaki ATCC 30864]